MTTTLRYIKEKLMWEVTYDDGTVRNIGNEAAAIRAAGPEFSYIPQEKDDTFLR